MKEELLNFKKLLERKCFASDDSFEYETENYIDVVRAINNEGAVAYIQDCFSRANQYLANNGIKCDELHLYHRFSLYFDAEHEGGYPHKDVEPVQDVLRVYVNGVGYSNKGKSSVIDQDDNGINDEAEEFIISFDEFKTLLEDRGITLGYKTTDQILEDYRDREATVCRITKSKSKTNKLKRDNKR